MKRESVSTVDMADGSSTLPGRRAARASLFSLFVQVLCIAHLHMCSGDQMSRELATAAALLSSATSFTTRVVIRSSPSNTQSNVLVRESQNTLEATRTSAPTVFSHTLLESTNEPAGSGCLGATYTFTTANGLASRRVPHKKELESVAKESDTLLETNEVSVSNTAGRYFEIIRPTRTTSGAAEGIVNVPVTSSKNSGEEKGASPSERVRPQTTTTKRDIATPMVIARESTAQDEEKSLVKKIWLVAEATSNPQVVPMSGGRPSMRPRPPQRLPPGSNRRPPSLLPPLSARPLPEDVSVIPVPFDTFELLPSTGTRDDGEGSDLGDVAPPDVIVEAEGSSEVMEDSTTQKEDYHKAAQTHFPQTKPEKDFKKPTEPIKEKDAPAKTSPGVVSTTSFKISSPIPTVVAMDVTTFGHYSTDFTGGSEEKQSTSDSATTSITTSTSSATTTTEEPSSNPEKLTSLPTPPSTATPKRPMLLEPSLGIGVAEAMIESSMQETLAASILPEGESRPEWLENPLATDIPTAVWPPSSVVYPPASKLDSEYSYRPRPGLVLDDPEYKPVGLRPLGVANLGSPPSIVTVPMENHHGEVFDVTVSAVQRPGGSEESGLTEHIGKPIMHPGEKKGIKISESSYSTIFLL